MKSFFLDGQAVDPWYQIIRDGEHATSVEARRFLDGLWVITQPYLEPTLRRDAQSSYFARFWEMYLTWALLQNGIALVPSSRRVHREYGPDLSLENGNVWIEAVVASAGTGPDAIPEHRPGSVYSEPDDQKILRIRSSIEEKARKFAKYISDGAISPAGACVIAIGAPRIAFGRSEATLPRIVRAVFPFGNLVAHFDTGESSVVGQSYLFREAITKASGSPVPTDIFLKDEYSHVSAVIYASVDELNHDSMPGSEFITVHNPLACSPLPHRTFPFGHEYWKEGDQLHCEMHRVST